jgi:hypothetical protein
MARQSREEMETFDKRIEGIILGKETFCAYDIVMAFYHKFDPRKNDAPISTDPNYQKRYQRVRRNMSLLEAKGLIKFLKEEDSRSPTKKRIYKVLK